MDLRSLEKSSKFGFMFYISYNGKKFDCFDTLKNKKSVKGEFDRIIKEAGFSWAKGIQQGGRTDAKVSASENILYMSSNYKEDLNELVVKFNKLSKPELQLVKCEKTLPNLIFPDVVKGRSYKYKYPKKRIVREIDEIGNLCSELSGTYDVSRFTDFKGSQLKEKVRSVKITFEEDQLYFEGSSFMPKQVRIMSAFILTDTMNPLPGKHLTLERIHLKEEMSDIIIREVKEIKEDKLMYAEKAGESFIFYVNKKDRGEFIGTRGKNIRKLRKKYGTIIVRDYD